VKAPRRQATPRARLWGAIIVVSASGLSVFAGVQIVAQLILLGADTDTTQALLLGYAIAAVAGVAMIAVGSWIATTMLVPRAADVPAGPVTGPVGTVDPLVTGPVPVPPPPAAPGTGATELPEHARSDAGETPEDTDDETGERQRQLLDDVRHELKTPITIVRGYLEIMDAGDPADVASTREIGISELDRMSRLVEDIELLASVEGAERLNRSAVDLRTLTARVGELVAVIPGHPWRVVSRGDAALFADPDRLLQAWLQLADNAAKHTPEGSPVEIGSDVDESRAHLWVRDHGPGVPPAARHRIFRRFDRVQPRRGVEGSGLGLAIVDAIARAHEGECAVSTTEGGGATFTISLPIGRVAPVAPAPVRAEDVVLQREATR
jgi:two-component system, OmpR family, sensor kinase